MIQTFSNPATIDILDSGSPPTIADPYPSEIVVSGMPSYTQKVTLNFDGFAHTAPADASMLLVGPTGAYCGIFSGVGAGVPVTGLDITLDDDAASFLPQSVLSSGTFLPSPVRFITPGDFPSPAPIPAKYLYTALAIFISTDPNGTWSLYITNAFSGSSGEITDGWSITVEAI